MNKPIKMNKWWRMVIKFIYAFIPDGSAGDIMRGRLYKPFMKKCGKHFKVYSQAFIFNPNLLSCGDHVCIGFNAYVGNGANIYLGDGVTLAPFTVVSSSNRTKKNGSYRFGILEKKEVRIGDGTQVAAHCVITAGVEIGRGCLIAAGSVVTKSFKDNDLVIAGVPAKIIKKK